MQEDFNLHKYRRPEVQKVLLSVYIYTKGDYESL